MYRRSIIKIKGSNAICLKLIPVIFLIVAVVLSVTGAGLLSYQKIKSKSCTETVTAIVTENLSEQSKIKSTNKRHRISTIYRPLFRYDYNGVEYDVVSNTASNPPKFEVGDVVELKINPDNPREFYALVDKTTNFIGIIFLCIGSLLLIICIIISVFISRNKSISKN